MARPRVQLRGALLLVGLRLADKTPPTVAQSPAPAALAPKLELDGPEAEAKDRARVLSGSSGVGGVMLYFDLSPRPNRAHAPSREKDSAAVRP